MDCSVYLAHLAEDGRQQTVDRHLEGTARRCAAFAAAFGSEDFGRLAGLAHDIGKCSDAFQRRLLKNGPKVDHATAGAIECARTGASLTACCVIGHHGGLPDFGNVSTDMPGDATFCGRLRKGLQGGLPACVWTIPRASAGIFRPIAPMSARDWTAQRRSGICAARTERPIEGPDATASASIPNTTGRF